MYKLYFSPAGRSFLKSLDKEIAQRILDKLKWLIKNIDNMISLPLRGRLSGLYKLRIGDFRVIYEINYKEKVITVHKIGHRKDIYK